jgi:hypothetical protein
MFNFMKNFQQITTTVILLLFGTSLFSQADFMWAKQGGNSSLSGGNVQVQNTSDGIISAGDFLETANFGQEEITSNGSSDIFIMRCDESGNVLQIRSFGGENEDLLKFLKVDSQGNIIISIVFTDAITIDGNEYTGLGGPDVLLIKLNPDFTTQWIKHYGTGLTDYVKGMDIDEDGNIIVFGKFKNEIEFDDITLTSMGSTDMYIAKYSPEGDVVFAFSEGGSSYEDAGALAVGPTGDFFISGIFYGETIINGETITTENPTGLFIAKYSSSNEFQWLQQVDGSNLIPTVFLAATTDGSVYISGGFQGDVSFGSVSLSTDEFDADIYITKYNPDGVAQWAGHGHSSAGDISTALSCDVGGNVYLAGYYLSSIDFNGVIVNYTLC